MSQKFHRREVVLGMMAGAVAVTHQSNAQVAYPSRPIRVVLAFPPGGASDLLGRIVTRQMSEELGQPFVMDNRPGATGHLAGEMVAKSRPDGYTLLFTVSSAQVVSPHVMTLNYDPMADLKAVGLAATVNNMIVASPSLPATTLPELIAYAKVNPGRVTYGSFGVGSNLHLAGELLGLMAGVKLRHVPYSNRQAIPDLLAGRLDMMIANISDVAQHVAERRLKALGASSLQRLPEFPNVPTVAETLPGYEVGSWAMLMAPSGAPDAIVGRLNSSLQRALGLPAVREAYATQHFYPAPMSVVDSAAFMNRHNEQWARVVREAGVPRSN